MKFTALSIPMQYRAARPWQLRKQGRRAVVRAGRTLWQQAFRGGAPPLPPGPTCWTGRMQWL